MAQPAYDLAHFQREERQPKPRVRVAKHQVSETRRQVGRMLRTLLAVAFLLTLVCAVLYTQTNLNELQRQIAAANKQLTEEQSNYAYLTFQLENMTSLKSIEARLHHFFNDRFTFEIQSRSGSGAFIEITVPDTQIDGPENERKN